jgi:serine/threonine-protein kinase RsbW
MSRNQHSSGPPLLRIELYPSLACLGPAGAMVNAIAREHGMPLDACSQLELAVVEAVTNVVKHGTGKRCGVEIEMQVWLPPTGIVLHLCDTGSRIPASALEAADGSVFHRAEVDIMDAPEGGMGLSLIRALVDELHYTVEDGRNTMCMVKNRGQ